MLTRRHVIKGLLGTFLAGLFAATYGFFIEPALRFRVRRWAVRHAGWPVDKPRATMFVWAPIPEPFRALGSVEFCKLMLREAKVAASPGIGFGEYGEGNVRFGLIENEHRTRQAVRGIRAMMRNADELVANWKSE